MRSKRARRRAEEAAKRKRAEEARQQAENIRRQKKKRIEKTLSVTVIFGVYIEGENLLVKNVRSKLW